jgi:hypothetical protein
MNISTIFTDAKAWIVVNMLAILKVILATVLYFLALYLLDIKPHDIIDFETTIQSSTSQQQISLNVNINNDIDDNHQMNVPTNKRTVSSSISKLIECLTHSNSSIQRTCQLTESEIKEIHVKFQSKYSPDSDQSLNSSNSIESTLRVSKRRGVFVPTLVESIEKKNSEIRSSQNSKNIHKRSKWLMGFKKWNWLPNERNSSLKSSVKVSPVSCHQLASEMSMEKNDSSPSNTITSSQADEENDTER